MIIRSNINLCVWFSNTLNMASYIHPISMLKVSFYSSDHRKYIFYVTLLLIGSICRACLLQTFLNFEKHPVENSLFFFLNYLCSFSFTILVVYEHKCWVIWIKFQLFAIAFFRLCKVWLYVNTSGIPVFCFFFVIFLISFCLNKVLVLSISFFVSFYSLSTTFLCNL